MRQSFSMIACVGCTALVLLTLASDCSAQVGIKRGGFYPGGSLFNDSLGYRGNGATGYGARNQYLAQPGLTVGSNPSANRFFYSLSNGNSVSPLLSPSDGRGMIVVTVPANADVFWNGTKSTLTGNTRRYITLPLLLDGAMQSFEARWMDHNGHPVTRHRAVRALPNRTVNADFMQPQSDDKTPVSK